MTKKIKKICEHIIKLYQNDKNILGIMVFGSVIRGRFDKYSDVDIYILLKKKGKYARNNFVYNKIRIDIIFDTMKESNVYLKADRNNVRRNTSHMLAHGEIIFQRTNDLEKIQKIAKRNLLLKTKYTKNEILMHKYSIDDFLGEVQRDLVNGDVVAFYMDCNLLMGNIIELFLKLHGDFFRQSNEMLNIFKSHDYIFAKRIDTFFKTDNIIKKKDLLISLVDYIYKKTGGSLPQNWVIK